MQSNISETFLDDILETDSPRTLDLAFTEDSIDNYEKRQIHSYASTSQATSTPIKSISRPPSCFTFTSENTYSIGSHSLHHSSLHHRHNTPNATPKNIVQTGRWSTQEHELFLKGLEKFGKSWKNIAKLVPTRTLVQIRTHAQKFLLKKKWKENHMNNEIKTQNNNSTILTTKDRKRPTPSTVNEDNTLVSSSSATSNYQYITRDTHMLYPPSHIPWYYPFSGNDGSSNYCNNPSYLDYSSLSLNRNTPNRHSHRKQETIETPKYRSNTPSHQPDDYLSGMYRSRRLSSDCNEMFASIADIIDGDGESLDWLSAIDDIKFKAENEVNNKSYLTRKRVREEWKDETTLRGTKRRYSISRSIETFETINEHTRTSGLHPHPMTLPRRPNQIG